MKVTTILCTLMAAAVASASVLSERDVCDDNSSDRRRTNSPCDPGNGAAQFCGCDRTGIVQCINGFWREVSDCVNASCYARNDGSGAYCSV